MMFENQYRTHTCAGIDESVIGSEVRVAGWVENIRDHGGVQFLDLRDASRKIGVTVTDRLILIPRKSVTAVIGISEKEIPQKRRGCSCCNMRKTCPYRKRGEHCGF